MRNGGVEKVLSKLLFVWKELGYNIVLFTDEEATSDDYEVPENLSRIYCQNIRILKEKGIRKGQIIGKV